MSKRLNLVGYCKNLENRDVVAELQGEEDKIIYLLSFMNSLKRIQIAGMRKEELPLVNGENIVEKL